MKATLTVLGLLAVALGSSGGALEAARAARENPWAVPRHVVFGRADDRDSWLMVEVHSHEVRRLSFPEDAKPEAVVASADGQFLCFTAFDPVVGNTLLYRLDLKAGASPQRIGDSQGYHADPVVSPDGKWVYFAHHPNARGRPREHESKAFAQLYRVRVDGTALEPLTNGAGCHFAPTVGPAGNVIYVHTSCHREHWLETLGGGFEGLPSLGKFHGALEEPSISPDGRRFIFWANETNSVALYEGEPNRSVPQLRARVHPGYNHLRPTFGAKPTELLFQTGEAVFIETGSGQPLHLISFRGGS
jgi:hypothetical protein